MLPMTHVRAHDEVFEPMDEKDVQMEEMMANMASMGMGAQMMSREDMLGDTDDEDEAEEQGGGPPPGGAGLGGFGLGGSKYEF